MFLKDLNQNQFKAVTKITGSLAVIAGAGTGKTRTLTYRIANLIKEGISPYAIVAMTFTNKAAREMKERVAELVGERAYHLKVSTFHSFCARFLRDEIHHLDGSYTRNFLILDEDDSKQIIRDTVKELNYDVNKYNSNNLKDLFSRYKNKQINYLDQEENNIFNKYNNYLKENNALDFDDLIVLTIKLLSSNESLKDYYNKAYTHFLIDEFQDTNLIQYQLIKLLGGTLKNVFVVGDPDQSIYGFRGANYDNLDLFIIDFAPELIVLDQNYRSKTKILEVANLLIGHATDRPEKNLKSSLGEGFPVIYETRESDRDEAYFVSKAIKIFLENGYLYNEIAVLYRVNSLSRVFEESFLKEKLPYRIYGGVSFFERKEIKDILAYLRLAINPADNISFKRVVNIPRRKLGQVTIGKLEVFANLNKISLFEAIDTINLPKQTLSALESFKKIIFTIKEKINAVEKLTDIVDIVGNESGYYQMLKNEGAESKDRLENVYELKAIFYEASLDYSLPKLEILEEVLNEMSLKTNLDKTTLVEAITLASIHQVKGLEYKVVFVVGLEEGIFPNSSAMLKKEFEEERRVFYVAITRAQERLIVSWAKSRFRFGTVRSNLPSVFLSEAGLLKEELPVFQEVVEVKTKDKEEFKLGDRINHESYGNGVVVQVEDDKIRVAFHLKHGIKTFLNNHPALTKVK
ncbi:MAG: UvrD-helicase domain-containing protein [Acholeplasmatales bacterium]|jgi:DNA helicase-2/ATP-dependent DNA helicase PcrA|nr:exodeoxyribonuclease V subunit gamma [Acholeplasmataceae bacterium]MCK9427398.1 exodeoxyribonuclease V subunit gamma [Acholeplasmataceae bacterium]MDY0115418.1 UvrD-helicase domain-containing protein [Acholeplasmatales bacterium]